MSRHTHTCVLAVALALAALFLVACGGGDSKPSTPTAAPSATTAATPAGDSGSVGAGKSLRSSDNRLEVRSSGKTALDVTLKLLGQPPSPPQGWMFIAPVYEITARDHDRLVSKLSDPFELRFNAGSDPATVMYYDDATKQWVIVESEVVDGTVVATTDHLTPYTAAKPAAAPPKPTPTPKPSATATATQAAASPSASASISRTPPGGTPGANVTATSTPISADAAKQALEMAVAQYKGKQVKVSGATGYSGSGAIALPTALDAMLGDLSATGQLVYGMYNGVNEAITSIAGAGSASGSLVLLVEPKTAMPSSSSDASAQLAKIFPGAVGPKYNAVGAGSSSNYAFFAQVGTTGYMIGFVTSNGMPLAFVAVASGSYYGVLQAAQKP